MPTQMLVRPKRPAQMAPIIPGAEFQGPSLWDIKGLEFADRVGSTSSKRRRHGRKRNLKPLEVLLDGLADGPSGFAVHLRDWARHLDHYGVKVRIPEHRACEYPEVAKLKKTKVENPIEILNYPGCSFHPKNPDRYVIGYSVFESLKFPPIFKENTEDVDELWTASRHCYDRFAEVGIEKSKIRVFHEGVDTTKFHPYVPKVLNKGNNFVFGSVMGWSARKGVHILLRAYLKEFDSSENVLLWICGGWYAREHAAREVDDIKEYVGKSNPPLIELDWADRRDEAMPGLFTSFDAFVLPTLGEGYSRTVVEAMSCGTPTISTDAPPTNEFLTDATGYPIKVDKIAPEPAADWICDNYKGADFYHPSEDDLRHIMRDVYEDYEKAEARAERGRRYILQHHNTATNVEKAIKRLREIQDNWTKA